jgi:hypothetical protein
MWQRHFLGVQPASITSCITSGWLWAGVRRPPAPKVRHNSSSTPNLILKGETVMSLRNNPLPRTLARVVAGVLLASSAPASAEEEPVASAAVQQELDAFLTRFRATLAAVDATSVAGMTQFPCIPYFD